MTSLPSLLVHRLHAFPCAHSATVWLLACAGLSLGYALTAILCGFLAEPTSGSKEELRRERTRRCKMRSWILTGVAAFVMTVGSVPFVWDLVRSGMDVGAIKPRPMISTGLVAFFLAYLQLDLAIGCLPRVGYRNQIALLTGWVHHSAYTCLLWVIMRRGLSHVFAGAAVMELPTFVLALSMMVPSTRSDLLFTSLFFVTRIVYHIVLLCVYFTPYGRLHCAGLASSSSPTWIPAIGLTLAAPLHITWFSASVRGMLRRRRAALRAEKEITAPRSPLLLPQKRPRLVSLASSYLASPRPTLQRLRSSPSLPSSAATRQRIEAEVSVFFSRVASRTLPAPAQNWLARDRNDVLKHQAGPGVTVAKIRVRAGRGAQGVKRLGARVGRAVGAV